MQWLAAICVRRPVFASVIALVLTVIGAFSYAGLGVDRFPKVEFPVVMAVTVVPGASPEQVETEVTDKIESAVNTISGIDELRSVSVEGVSQVIVTFVLEKDINVASQEVREKINEILATLPAGIDPPVVAKLDPDSTPILTLAVTGPGDARDITELADKTIRREIESLNGVGQVTVVGGRARQINVWVDPAKLEKYEMSGGQLEHALRTQNVELPSGRVEKGETQLTLRTLGRVQSIQQLADVTVAMRAGQPIRLRDVAQVEDGMAEAESAGFRGTSPTVLLNIRKQSGTNTVEVVERVKDRVRDLAPRLPAGASIEVARDQSEFIGNAIATVKEHLIVGALLASIVVLLFLRNWRSTLIAAIAIPVSVISTFALMKSAGFTLNVITMLGLTLAVGIVIDDAIVVLENIYRHIEEKGTSPYQAAIDGTKEIGLAVLATTISLVAVFLPVAFMGGIVGRFMNSFGLTMAFAIMISLLVSFVLTPMMSARWLRPAAAAEGEATAAHGSKSSRFYAPIEAGYMRLLGFSMRHRWVIVIATLATLASTPVLAGLANKNFLPDEDESQFMANIRLPEGTSLDATRIAATRLAGDIGKLDGVKYAITTIGDDPQKTPNLANIYVKLVPSSERKRSQAELIAAAREVVARHPETAGYRVAIGQVPMFSGGMPNFPVVFQLQGPELPKLEGYARALMERLARQPGVKDPDTSMITGKPELRAHIDRKKAADLGVSVADVAGALRLLGRGLPSQHLQRQGRAVRGQRAGRGRGPQRRLTPQAHQRAERQARNGHPRQRRQLRRGQGTGPHRSLQSQEDPDRHGQPCAGLLGGRGLGRSRRRRGGAEDGPQLQRRPVRALQGAGPRLQELRPGVLALVHLHVPGLGGAVRVVAAPDHDLALAAADRALCPDQRDHLWTVAEHLQHAGHPGAVWHRQEELDLADRSHHQAAGRRHAQGRSHPDRQPRPAAPDLDDHRGLRGRHAALGGVDRRRRGHQPRHGLRDHRRSDLGALAHALGDAGGLLALRRSLGEAPQVVPDEAGSVGAAAQARGVIGEPTGSRGVGCVSRLCRQGREHHGSIDAWSRGSHTGSHAWVF